ncbi:MAG: DUF4250 domain-containing protein [Lachnospiraceae bacterium]|nr:DUF4250 domain-containing protein [Lachnospiraceae bacterium]
MMPKDPAMLLSYVNLKLRDHFSSLEDMCEDQDCDREELERILAGIDYHYDAEVNQFI